MKIKTSLSLILLYFDPLGTLTMRFCSLKHWFLYYISPKLQRSVRRKSRYTALTLQTLEERIALAVNVTFLPASTSGYVDIVVQASNSTTNPVAITLDSFTNNGGLISVENDTIECSDQTNGLLDSLDCSATSMTFFVNYPNLINNIVVGGTDATATSPGNTGTAATVYLGYFNETYNVYPYEIYEPNVFVNASTISFNGTAFGNPIPRFHVDNLSLTSVNSLILGSASAQYVGSATINSVPSGSNQPFAGSEYITGSFNWGDLGFAAGQELAYQINGGTTDYTATVAAVIGTNLYFQPGSASDSQGSCQIAIGVINPAARSIFANNFDLKVSGNGSIISGSIASDHSSPTVEAQSNNGAITLAYWNDHQLNQTLNLGTIDAGDAPVDLYFSMYFGNPFNYQWGVYSNPNTYLEGSAINVITSGGNVSLNTRSAVTGKSLPVSVIDFNTGWDTSADVYSQPVYGNVTICDYSDAGLNLDKAWVEINGQAATVTNNSVQYNQSLPNNTTPSYGVASDGSGNPYGNLTLKSTGPVYLNTISAVGVVNITASAILSGDDQKATITAQEVILNAQGLSAFQGEVTFAKKSGGDTLTLSPDLSWSDYGFAPNQIIFISGAISSGNNGTFTVASVNGNVLTLVQAGKLTDETDSFISIGNGVIGSASDIVSLPNVPVFTAMTTNGPIYLNSGSSLNNTAMSVKAGGANGVLNNAFVQSSAQFFSVQNITATGAAIVQNSSGSIVNAQTLLGSTANGSISGQTVSLSSPYSLGTSTYPLYVDTSNLVLNATATSRSNASIYVINTNDTALKAIDVSTYNGDVTIVDDNTPALTFKNNLLVENGTAVLNFSNTDSNNGNVIIGSTVYANSINAGYSSNGNPGTGQIFTNSSGLIDGKNKAIVLTAASGIGTSAQPLLLQNVPAVLASSDSNDIYFSDASSTASPLTLSALTSTGNIGVNWNGTIQLASALSSQPGVVFDSISASGTVSLIANSAGSSIINLDNSNISAGSLNLSATEKIGSIATPLQVNSPATLTLSASGGNGIYISANSSIAVSSASVTSGDISLSAIGDVTLAGNITGGVHTALTATGGALTQSAGVVTGSATGNLVITANSIGNPTNFIQTNVAAITANVDDGGIYLSNNNISPLTLSAAAVGTADGPTANNISIYSAGDIQLQQQSNSLTQLATPLPVAIFSPGGETNLFAGKTMSRDGSTITGAGNGTITSDSATATATASINQYGKVSAVNLTSGGAGYTAPPQVTFSGGGGTGAAATTTMMSLNGFNNGSGWETATQDIFTPTVTNNVLTLTQSGSGGNTVNAFWANEKIATNQRFDVSYTWQGTANGGDGMAFVIQNSPQGLNAFGVPGTGHGNSGITNSLAFELDASNNTIAVNTGGIVGSYVTLTGGINLNSGNPIQITLSYDAVAQTLTQTLTDSVAGKSYFRITPEINLPQIVGGQSAYIGFTSPTGDGTATQTVAQFSYRTYISSVLASGFTDNAFYNWYPITNSVFTPTVSNNVLTLTNVNQPPQYYFNTANAYWFNRSISTNQSFTASYTYQGTSGGANGVAFVIQNEGLDALGSYGDGLGYRGITSSLAFGIQEYYAEEGIAVGTGGNIGPYQPTDECQGATCYGLDLSAGHPINVQLSYDSIGQNFSQALTDTVTGQTYSRVTTGINLSQIVGGDSAFLGFTGATGGLTATQTVSNFSYTAYEQNNSIGFNSNGTGWTPAINAFAPTVSGNVFQLTKSGVNNTANALWYNQTIPLDQPFQVSYTWQGTADGADGVAFVIQNSPQGVNAIGTYGNGQGYSGIPNSLAFEIEAFNNTGIAVGTGGNIGSYINSPQTPLNSGHPIDVSLAYDPFRQTLTQTLTDTKTYKTFTRTTTGINLVQIVGGTSAYIGFTGSTGTTTATQTVWNFVYTPSDVSGITIKNAGTGYTSAPIVTIAPPGDDIYTGTYSLNGITNVNSSSPSYLQSLVIISATQEVPPPSPVTQPTPALVTWDDLTYAIYEAQLKNQTNIPIANGTETLDYATQTVTITAAAITIDALGQSGNAGTATIPDGWSLVLKTTGTGSGNSIVFLNPSDTIETSGGGTISIVADSLASIGNLKTAGGNITVQAGGNIAIGKLAAGQSGALGAIQVTSSNGVILSTSGSSPNLTGASVTLNQGGQVTPSGQSAALAQINAMELIAAANAAYSRAVAAEASAEAQTAANLALMNSLAKSLPKLQASVTTAKQMYEAASSKANSDSSSIRSAFQELIDNMNTYNTQTNSLGSADESVAWLSIIASTTSFAASFAESVPIVKNILNAAAFASLAGLLVSQSIQVSYSNDVSQTLQQIQEDAQRVEQYQYQFIIDQGIANQAFTTWQTNQTALTALQVAYSVAQQAYRASQQTYANAQSNTAAVQAQGASNSATAIANIVFASAAQPVSIQGSLSATISNTNPLIGALDITSNIITNTPLTLQAGPGANSNHTGDNLTVASGVTVQSTGSTISLSAGNNISLHPGSKIISPANEVTITGNTNGNPAGATITLAGTVTATSVFVGVDPSATGNEIFNITPSPTTPITVDGGRSSSGVNTLNFDAWGHSIVISGNTITAGNFSPVTFLNIQYVNILNAANASLTLTGNSGQANTMNLVGKAQRAGIATLNGTAISFSNLSSFTYNAGIGDTIAVTPFANNERIPWDLAVRIAGVAGSPASLTYNSSSPFCDAIATGNYLGYIIDSGVATVRFSNVNQVTIVNPIYSTVAKLPNLTISVQSGPYTGNPYTATAQINGANSLDGITPQITYYSGTIVNPRYKLSSAPVNAGVYTAVASYPGDATWVSETVSATMTINQTTASPWQNPVLPEDVNGETGVNSMDVLVLVNDINLNNQRSLEGSPLNPPPYLDVNGDRYANLLDVLFLVNYLNRNQNGGSGSGGEGEQSFAPIITGSVHSNESASRLVSSATMRNNSLTSTWIVEPSGSAIQSQISDRYTFPTSTVIEAAFTAAGETEKKDKSSLQAHLGDRDDAALCDLFFSVFEGHE